ncbi:MAG: hypothetical protein M3Y72_05670 [Acidobacteriota bacterium]|nr:hypothetical protein [Acidobacteriota bacterium]
MTLSALTLLRRPFENRAWDVRNNARVAFLTLLIGYFCWSWYGTIARVVALYNPLPVLDYWRIPQNLHFYRALDPRVLWVQHNEHRIIFPEIIFAADMLFCRGLMLLPLAISGLAYFSIWVLFAWVILKDSRVSSTLGLSAVLLAGLVLGWNGSADVLGFPFLLQWTLMQASCVAALVLLSRVDRYSRKPYLAGAIALAVVATYSSGNGMLIWPILIGAGLLLRLGRRRVSILVVSAALAIGVYFIGYKSGKSLDILGVVKHPLYTFAFVCSYLSMPFGLNGGPRSGVLIGIGSLISVAGCIVVLRANKLLREPPFIVLVGSYLMAVLSALLTATGRMDVADPNFLAAKVPRYLTVPLATWGALILLLLWSVAQLRPIRTAVWPVACLLVLLLGFNTPKVRNHAQSGNEDFALYQMATLSVQSGLMAPEMIQWIFPQTAFVQSVSRDLSSAHLSIYRNDRSKWLGHALADFARVSDVPTAGQITYLRPIEGGYLVVGWYFDGRRTLSHDRLLLINEKKQIIGFGRRLPAGFPSTLHTSETPDSLAWIGFVNSSVPSRAISAYIVETKKKSGVSQIPDSTPMPSSVIVNAKQAGDPLPVQVSGDLQQISSKIPALDPSSDIPSGTVYGTWNGSDANTARIFIRVQSQGDCLIVPVLTGPVVKGLSVSVSDATTGVSLGAASMLAGSSRWEFWRFSIPSVVNDIEITASDQGSQWGEWVAVAQPLSCK